jgi:excinuclease ABC subunit C
VYKGTLENKQEYDFGSNDDFFEEFLIQYYSENPVPKELIIPIDVDESVISYLKLKRGGAVKVTVPKRGEKKRLLELVSRNIQVSFFGNFDKLEDLKDNLDLQEVPSIIECFDISHLSGTSTTASMVQFRSALPHKNNYRRFKIRTVDGVDDTAAIAEVVRRRYSRLIAERSEMPNLILIDGGLGQLNAAQKVLWELDVNVPVVAIAKRFEELYLPGKKGPIILDKKSKALQLLQHIRDEAHRFALQYNRLLRKKELTE